MMPDGFLWGAATSAYQIEGGSAHRGRSIWDSFTGVHHGDTGEIACDHFGRWREDLDLMAELGFNAYRFSIAWTRGLDFYERLADGLLERGIEPMPTLYHWDLPEELHDKGGWLERSTVDAFVEYASEACGRLGDRVRLWTTVNEPWVAGMVGYGTRALAPGLGDGAAALQATHHLLLAHGHAASALRGGGRQVGLVLNLSPMVPASDSPADVAAAERFDGYLNRWFLDAALLGQYPPDMLDWYGCSLDASEIAAPLDFLGVNYYCRMHIAAGDNDGDPFAPRPSLHAHQVTPAGVPTTAMGWPIEPEGLSEMLLRLRDEYAAPPIYITENGAAFHDYADPSGEVRDPERIAFLDGHLRALREAIAQGVDVRGYFCWSLLDNFEWQHGYSKRFGLVHVDFPTGRRTPKASARWYADMIRRNP